MDDGELFVALGMLAPRPTRVHARLLVYAGPDASVRCASSVAPLVLRPMVQAVCKPPGHHPL